MQCDAVWQRACVVVVERKLAAVLNVVSEMDVLRRIWLHVECDCDSAQARSTIAITHIARIINRRAAHHTGAIRARATVAVAHTTRVVLC